MPPGEVQPSLPPTFELCDRYDPIVVPPFASSPPFRRCYAMSICVALVPSGLVMMILFEGSVASALSHPIPVLYVAGLLRLHRMHGRAALFVLSRRELLAIGAVGCLLNDDDSWVLGVFEQ